MGSSSQSTEGFRPTPLDFLILEALPEKAILGGVHWAGRPVKHVVADINESTPIGAPLVTSSMAQSRVRSMKVAGYVSDFPSHGSGRIWAKLPAARDLQRRKSELLGIPAPDRVPGFGHDAAEQG